MNNQTNNQKNISIFHAHDKNNKPVMLEAFATTMFAPEFSCFMKTAWEVARPAYIPIELDFLRAYPDVIHSDPYFKPFETLFSNGLEQVDWKIAQEKMGEQLKSHFIFDIATWPQEVIQKFAQDICYVVSVKDPETHKLLGFITFLARQNYPVGTVKVMTFALDPLYQNRGLGKILMSSIFKIAPEIQRIFLCTRVTNSNALRAYRNWGFIDDKNPILDHAFNLNHWMFLEYKTEQSNILQKTAKLIE